MLNTLLPLLLAVPITVTPYQSPYKLTVEDMCHDIAISLSMAVEEKVIETVDALDIYVRCLKVK